MLEHAPTISSKSRKLVCWDFDLTLTDIHIHNTMHEELTVLMRTDEGRAFKKKCKVDGGYKISMGLAHFNAELLAIYREKYLKPENLRNMIPTGEKIIALHNAGHAQAVTSFTWFPQLLEPTIRFILENYYQFNSDSEKLSDIAEKQIEEICSQLLVVGGFPDENPEDTPLIGGGDARHTMCKLPHLLIAQKYFGIDDNNKSNICLVDDSSSNCSAAKRDGFDSVEALRWGGFFYLDYLQRTFIDSPIETQKRMQARHFLTSAHEGSDSDDWDSIGESVDANEVDSRSSDDTGLDIVTCNTPPPESQKRLQGRDFLRCAHADISKSDSWDSVDSIDSIDELVSSIPEIRLSGPSRSFTPLANSQCMLESQLVQEFSKLELKEARKVNTLSKSC